MKQEFTIKSYKDLIVWKKSYELVKEVYKISSYLPERECYGLQSQIRRSAVSVPSNIAEGYRRKTTGAYIQFLNIAYGSAGELETQLLLCKDLYNLNSNFALQLLDEVSRMLWSMSSKLKPVA